MLAPPAVRFCELPIHIVPPPAVTVGKALTVTDVLDVLLHPLPSVTVTV